MPLGLLAVGFAVVFLLFDWNWFKGPLERRVSAALGREFRIVGPLDVDLSLTPKITALDVRLANPAWASDGPMLSIQRAEIVVDVRALLDGRIELPAVSLIKPEVRLETRPDGPPNWRFDPGSPDERPVIPEIRQLRIADASIRYLDHGSGRLVSASLDQVSGSTGGPDAGMTLNATGAIAAQPLDLKLTGPPLAQLADGAKPYALAVDMKLGASDLAGDVTLDLGEDVPAVRARLHSDQVDSAELAGLLGAAGAAGDQAAAPSEPAAPVRRGLDPERLPRLSADLDYTIGHLAGPDLRLQDVALKAGLHDRLPSLMLKGAGSFKGEPVTLDVQARPIEDAEQPQPGYRIDAEIAAGQTRITASGAIDQPESLQGVHVQFTADSSDLAEILRMVGIDLPELPGLQASGQLIRDGRVWQLNDLRAKVGESDLSGRLSADLSGPRPLILVDLRSDRLLAADLMPGLQTTQAATETAAEASAKVPIITASGIDLDALPDVDADISFAAAYVEAPEVVLDQLRLDLQLRDRIAVVDATGEGRFRDYQPVAFEAHAGHRGQPEEPGGALPDRPHAAGGRHQGERQGQRRSSARLHGPRRRRYASGPGSAGPRRHPPAAAAGDPALRSRGQGLAPAG